MITSQKKPPKTLINYMGISESDLLEPDHDDWSLKLLNPELIDKITWKKIFNEKPAYKKLEKKQTVFKYENNNNSTITYRLANDDGYPNPQYPEKLVGGLDNIQVYANRGIEISNLEMGHVVVKKGYNRFSQRLGFVDIFCNCNSWEQYSIKVDDETCVIEDYDNKYVVFFKVQTTPPNVSLITRSIEFFREALDEVENYNNRLWQSELKKVLPFLVAKEKLPVTQFDTITFDEILQMEKQIK